MRLTLLLLLTILGFISSFSVYSAVRVGQRHMVLVQADLENIWGSYYFAVVNNGSESKPYSMPLLLPEETIDFRAQEGLSEQDIQIDDEGVIRVIRDFSPGMHLMSVSFQVAVKPGLNQITFRPLLELEEFSVAAMNMSQIKLSSSNLGSGLPSMLGHEKFSGLINRSPIKLHDKITVEIDGIPNGRHLIWKLGIIFAGILLLFSSLLVLKGSRSEPNQLETV